MYRFLKMFDDLCLFFRKALLFLGEMTFETLHVMRSYSLNPEARNNGLNFVLKIDQLT